MHPLYFRSWENAIHLYKGPDPLEYWFHYVNWYEQNYCYDATNKLPELLLKVLGQFNNINAYKQDHRMVKVWLKYVSTVCPYPMSMSFDVYRTYFQVELQPNPLNIYQNLYQRGVGTQLSFFYIAWANCYLKENDFKLAESAINWGFQAHAKPLEDLQSAQQQVANSYYEFTQLQRPGPYQIVVQPQPSNHQQPPLPAQLATNYQNPSYARDKRKLEDTFPLHDASHQQGQAHVKRSRPNEGEYNVPYGAASGGYHSPVASHYTNQGSPKPAMTYHNNYSPQPQYAQHASPVPSGGLENGKFYDHHQEIVYQGQQPPTPQQAYHHVQTYPAQPVAQQQQHQVHQNGQPQNPQIQQHTHVHPSQPVAYEQAYQASSISNNSGASVPPTTISHHNNSTNGHQYAMVPQQTGDPFVPSATNGYSSDLQNSGYVIASSLNYVYEDYHQGGPGCVGEVIEEVVEEQVASQPATEEVAGIQIPPNFARSATNCNNFWRAPLFLEEPYNANQRPMYTKEQVYPATGAEPSAGAECEYSFEELRKSARRTAAAKPSQYANALDKTAATLVDGDVDTYEEYWTEEVTVQQADEFPPQSGGGALLSGRIVSEDTYGEYVQDQGHENGGSVYYHVMEPKAGSAYGEVVRDGRKSSAKSSKKKSKRKKMIVQINDTEEDDEDEDDYGEESNEGGAQETTTIRYTCDQNGLSSDGLAGGGDMRRITIKLRKQIAMPQQPASATSTPKVPYGSGRNGNSNGYGSSFYRRTATDADADLLLSLGNGQSGFYQEMKEEDSSNFSEYNTAYNSSYLGENSNSGGFASAPTTEPSTPVASFQHRSRLTSISGTSTPQLTPAYRRLTKHRSNVSLMNDDSMSSTMNENSFFQGELDEEVKSRRMARALATIDEQLSRASIDPFNAELCKALLTKIGFPSYELCDVYRMVQQPLPKLSNAKQVLLGDTYYSVEKEVGRGTYGAVYKATNAYSGATVAIKFQRPANSWELYICNEIKKRIKYHDIVSISAVEYWAI